MKNSQFVIKCRRHPRYQAKRVSKCDSCNLIFIMRHQHERGAEEFLGGLNPYAYMIDNLEDACGNLRVHG